MAQVTEILNIRIKALVYVLLFIEYITYIFSISPSSSTKLYDGWTQGAIWRYTKVHNFEERSLFNQSLGRSRRNALVQLWIQSGNLLRRQGSVQGRHLHTE